ncbi:hypothetical protein GCM10023331_06230 [Algivirga pacifica]|uniref:Uncharacterized protein n=1 Tax=Algivirga pacifica TaxID=1162670 RepID=A0ABP9D7M4_9BACT
METDLESACHSFNYYDQGAEVNESVKEAIACFNTKMSIGYKTSCIGNT